MHGEDYEATTMANLVGIDQLATIRRLARSAGLDADEECKLAMKCKTEDLSKRGAEVFIKHLETFQPQRATA